MHRLNCAGLICASVAMKYAAAAFSKKPVLKVRLLTLRKLSKQKIAADAQINLRICGNLILIVAAYGFFLIGGPGFSRLGLLSPCGG